MLNVQSVILNFCEAKTNSLFTNPKIHKKTLSDPRDIKNIVYKISKPKRQLLSDYTKMFKQVLKKIIVELSGTTLLSNIKKIIQISALAKKTVNKHKNKG